MDPEEHLFALGGHSEVPEHCQRAGDRKRSEEVDDSASGYCEERVAAFHGKYRCYAQIESFT